jgi:hypothetical protein
MIAQKKVVMLAHNNGAAGKNKLEGSDLLSLLVKQNLAADLKPEERMTDEEILARESLSLLSFTLCRFNQMWI